MNDWLIYVVGFTAQFVFSGRSILQWLVSERHHKVMTPILFWQLSLLASFLLFLYGYFRNDFAIMLGQILTYFIYIRNMQLQHSWDVLPKVVRRFLYMFPVIILFIGYNNHIYDRELLFNNENIPFWLLWLGIVAQVVFTLRFIYQWIYSERRKESFLPMGFWILSVLGSSLILMYAIYRKDPVLLLGHGVGVVIYSRNLFLLKNQKKK